MCYQITFIAWYSFGKRSDELQAATVLHLMTMHNSTEWFPISFWTGVFLGWLEGWLRNYKLGISRTAGSAWYRKALCRERGDSESAGIWTTELEGRKLNNMFSLIPRRGHGAHHYCFSCILCVGHHIPDNCFLFLFFSHGSLQRAQISVKCYKNTQITGAGAILSSLCEKIRVCVVIIIHEVFCSSKLTDKMISSGQCTVS